MKHFGTHRWMDVQYYRESVYVALSAPPQPQMSLDIVRGEAFDVFGTWSAESELISQGGGNRLRRNSAADVWHPKPFFSDVSLLMYKVSKNS